MAFAALKLVPGFDVEKTPTLNQAGISEGNLVRWREGLVEKIGGWVRFYPFSIGSIPRDLHAWQDINSVDHLSIGATAGLLVITNGNSQTITPQVTTTNTPPNLAMTSGSNVVTIVDSNITGPTTNNSVFFATPVWLCGVVLEGLYKITANLSSHSYQIAAGALATFSTTTHTVTMTNANPGVVSWASHGLTAGTPVFFSTTGALPTNVTPFKTYFVLAAGLASGAFEFSDVPGGTPIDTTSGAQSGVQTAVANGGCVPIFTTTINSASVNVQVDAHGLGIGEATDFLASTSVGGATIEGSYLVQSVTDADNYSISVTPTATSSATALMNSGNVRYIYYIAIGPQAQAKPYGAGPYGADAYGVGSAAPSGPGTPITAVDWTEGNWGEILVACPQGGGIYQWSPDSGFQTAQLISNAPIANAGMFVAMPYQIIVAYGSSFTGVAKPLEINWCTVGDFTDWTPSSANQAGGHVIPTGSAIVGGLQAPQQGLIWTDIDLYTMQYVGPPNVFGFTKIMSGCGLIGSHACGQLGSSIYWMSQQQFFSMASGGAPRAMPCSVWDYVFQDLDMDNAYKIRCKPNSNFGTIGWEFPSLSRGTGENDSYVEYNAIEGEWTTGAYPQTGRSAWIDQSLLGPPIAGTPTGLIYQHEVGYNGDDAALLPYFQTGFFVIGEGEDFYFVDQFIPDFKYGTQAGTQGAQLLVTLLVVDFPGAAPVQKGPYTINAAKKYITTRCRGRQLAFKVQSADLNSFWRIGLSRYRYGPAGRR